MIPLERRLRQHFEGERFQPEPEWEARLVRELGLLPRSALSSVSAPGRRVRRLITSAMVALLSLFAVVTIITAMPAFAAGETPAWVAGLRSTIRMDSSGGDHATSWGYTLDLIGVYTDDQRSIVVLKGRGLGSRPAVYGGSLSAGAHRLDFQQSVTGDDGLYAVKFAALPVHRTSPTPVTLHLSGGFPLPQFWSFNFTFNDAVRAQTIPEPGRAGKLAINFVSIRVGPGTLAIRFIERGASYDDLFTPATPPTTDPRTGITLSGGRMLLMHSQVFDPNGRPLRWLDTRVDSTSDGVSFDTVLLRTGPGPYRIVITAPDGGTLERTIQG